MNKIFEKIVNIISKKCDKVIKLENSRIYNQKKSNNYILIDYQNFSILTIYIYFLQIK